MSDWRTKPTVIEKRVKEFDVVMAIDENGTTDLKGIISNPLSKNKMDRWFTITGTVQSQLELQSLWDSMEKIKNLYWRRGIYQYKSGLKKVVFHSRDIRKKQGAFNPKVINYESFMEDITDVISNSSFTIFSSSIDKLNHVIQYSNPYPVYHLCLEFIVERYCMYLRHHDKNGILLLESRGKKEDKQVHEYLLGLLKNGNSFWDKEDFSCIDGIYFNPKRSAAQDYSYPNLELADLVSYPIYKYMKTQNKDRAYETIERHIFNYPNIFGYGLKTFP